MSEIPLGDESGEVAANVDDEAKLDEEAKLDDEAEAEAEVEAQLDAEAEAEAEVEPEAEGELQPQRLPTRSSRNLVGETRGGCAREPFAAGVTFDLERGAAPCPLLPPEVDRRMRGV